MFNWLQDVLPISTVSVPKIEQTSTKTLSLGRTGRG